MKAATNGVPRPRINLVGRPLLLDAAPIHDDHAIGETHGLVLIMGDDDGRRADGSQDALQLEAQLLPQLGIERRQRLVEEHQLRLRRQHAGKRNALLLAAAQLPRRAALEPLQLHEPQHFADASGNLGFRPSAVLQAVGDILGDRHMRKQRIVLEEEAHIALIGALADHRNAFDLDRTFVRFLETGNQAKRRGLAATARPEQRDGLAGGHGEGHPIDGRDLPEPFDDLTKLDDWRG